MPQVQSQTISKREDGAKLIKKFKCNYCDRYFTRSEHRSRHELSHSNERPYRCTQCVSSFVRRDLLLRHCRTVHGSTSMPPAKRKQQRSHHPEPAPEQEKEPHEPLLKKEISTAMLMTEMHNTPYSQGQASPQHANIPPVTSPHYDSRWYMQQQRTQQTPQQQSQPAQQKPLHHALPSHPPPPAPGNGPFYTPPEQKQLMMLQQQYDTEEQQQAERPLNKEDLQSIADLYLQKTTFDPPKFRRVAPEIDHPVDTPQLGPTFDAQFFVSQLKNRPSIRADTFPAKNISRLQLDRYLSAYFCFFHPIMPMFHAQSFDTHRANFFLMNSILALGAILCHEEAMAQLFSYNSRIILNSDTFAIQDQLAASQTLILIIIFASYTGDMAGAEIANARTLLVRVVDQVLDSRNLKTPGQALKPVNNWGQWIQDQICIRTYWCTLIAVTTLAAIFNSSSGTSPEVTHFDLLLPCSEVIWNNQFDTEQAWHTRYLQELNEIPMMTVGELMGIIDNAAEYMQNPPLLNPFSVRILGNILFLRASRLTPSAGVDIKKALSLQMSLWQKVACDPYPGQGQGAMLSLANLPLISLMKPLEYGADRAYDLPQSILGAMQCRQHPIIILSYTLLGTARLQLILDLSLVRESLNYQSAQRVAEAALTCLNSIHSHNDEIIEQMTRIVISSCDVIRATCLLGQRMYQAFLQSPLTGSIAGQCMVLAYELILGVIIWCYRVEERILESNLNPSVKPIDENLQKVYRWINQICLEAGIQKVYGTLAPALAESIAELFDAIKTWRLAEVMAMSLRLFARGLLSAHSELHQQARFGY